MAGNGEVAIKSVVRAADGSSAALTSWALEFKDKTKTRGALRWACLVRNGGNFNTDNSNRSKVQVSLAGPEALESLYFRGEFYRS
jgi:hypothetical protein